MRVSVLTMGEGHRTRLGWTSNLKRVTTTALICGLLPLQLLAFSNFRSGQVFYENKGQIVDDLGQTRSDIKAYAYVKGTAIYVFENQISFVFQETIENDPTKVKAFRLDYKYRGAVNTNAVHLLDREPDPINFITNPNGSAAVQAGAYNRVLIQNLYEGIDLELSFFQGFLSMQYIFHSGANPKKINVKASKTPKLEKHADGSVEIHAMLAAQSLKFNPPVSVKGNSYKSYAFEVSESDTSLGYSWNEGEDPIPDYMIDIISVPTWHTSALAEDPAINWSTLYGGYLEDRGEAVHTDAQGNIYIVGTTHSRTGTNQMAFPTTAGVVQEVNTGMDAFLVKFNAKRERVFSTFLGGNNDGTANNGADIAFGVTTDVLGNIYVTGCTNSFDFPVKEVPGGFIQKEIASSRKYDGFLSVFKPDGSELIWSTYIGGAGDDMIFDIYSDLEQGIVLNGYSTSSDFPVQDKIGSFFQPILSGESDGFVLKFQGPNASHNRLPDYWSMEWGTFLGGAGFDASVAITPSANGTFVVGGSSISLGVNTCEGGYGFPICNKAQHSAAYQQNRKGDADITLSRFTMDGKLEWSTFYGGPGKESGTFTVGYTKPDLDLTHIRTEAGSDQLVLVSSTTKPLVTEALRPWGQSFFNPDFGGGPSDAIMAMFSDHGELQWGTHIGGSGEDHLRAVSWNSYLNTLVVGGSTSSTNYPTMLPNDLGEGQYFLQDRFQGATDGVLSRFTLPSLKMDWSTLIGGVQNESINAIDMGLLVFEEKAEPFILISGKTESANFPLMDLPGNRDYFNAEHSSLKGLRNDDIFVMTLAAPLANDPGSTGIQKLQAQELNIRPNPVKNSAWVDLPAHAEAKSYRIMNSSGQVVYTGAMDARLNSSPIHVPALPSGPYQLIVSSEKASWSARIIKE